MLELRIQTHYKILKPFFQNLKEVFGKNLNNFEISQVLWKRLKTKESKSLSSYRIVKIFSITEEVFKEIIQKSLMKIDLCLNLKKNRKNLFNLSFSRFKNLSKDSLGIIRLDKLCQIKISANTSLNELWNKYVYEGYKKRNSIVHSSLEEYVDPALFFNIFLLLIFVSNEYIRLSLKSEINQKSEKETIVFKIDKDIMQDTYIDKKIINSSKFLFKLKRI